MKRLSMVLLMLLFFSVYAEDIVKLHRGEEIKGKVIEINDSYIRFIYEGEDVPVSISKIAIESILYNSGRVETCTPRVEFAEYGDPSQVVILRDKEEVAGLTRLKEITAKSGGFWSISTKEGRYIEKNFRKLQQQAYQLGGCAVLITSQSGNSASAFKDAHSAMTATVYKY